MRILIFCFILFISSYLSSQNLTFEDDKTPDYSQILSYYDSLDNNFENAKLTQIGLSDVGKPIHLFIIDSDREFKPKGQSKRKKTYFLINNGIHPGEACGIEASMELAAQFLSEKSLNDQLDNIVLLIIPVYNIGGVLNRNSTSRVNQNGPEMYGFRANAKNLDLNRDFIKADSKNAESFNKFYTEWDPDVFVETHTTNGSDHSYSLTLISSQKDKLNPEISAYQYDKLLPSLYSKLAKKSMPIIPYIYPINRDPKKGIKSFLETPRYSSGYASLFDSFGFMTEAHSYKKYSERKAHTLEFLKSMIEFLDENYKTVLKSRKRAKTFTQKREIFPFNFVLDSSYTEQLRFKGYELKEMESSILSNKMYSYDTTNSYDTIIPYYTQYIPSISIQKPKYYIIPQAYRNVINRLNWNKIKIVSIKEDTVLNGISYYISNYNTVNTPYEGHYLHYDIQVEKKKEEFQFFKGDYIVSTEQRNIRYLVETLEPQSVDGFFAWNFFDGILQQKEWFSDFSFVPKAEKILEENDSLKIAFEEKIKTDSSFAKDDFKKLFFIYKSSKYYEKSAFRYPIIRIED